MTRFVPLMLGLFTAVAAAWAVPPNGWPGRVDLGFETGAAALDASRAEWRNAEDWSHRADRIRRHLARTLRLDPPPALEPPPLEVTAVVAHDGIVIENVRFETMPGLFVHANIYRPAHDAGPRPLVLRAHGHFRGTATDPEGRFQHDVQRLCTLLARGGAMVVAWDMMGWGESRQVTHERVETGSLQTFNTMRILDAMLERDDVDPDRVAMTGSSGGGTQTFLATALDPRIRFSSPVVMVSAHFFGGCPCESGLPIHDIPADDDGPAIRTSNVEFAALAAPRPQCLVSVGGDWTVNTPEVEYPYLQAVYGTLGAADSVSNRHLPDEEHDFGASKMNAVIEFLAARLGLDDDAMRGTDGGPDLETVSVRPRAELQATTALDPLPDVALRGDLAARLVFLALPRERD